MIYLDPIKRFKYLREQYKIGREKWKEAENKLKNVQSRTVSND